jgi:hypothetical protein
MTRLTPPPDDLRLLFKPTLRSRIGDWLRGQVGYTTILRASIAVIIGGTLAFTLIGIWVNWIAP